MGGGSQLYINRELVCDRNGASDWGTISKTLQLSGGQRYPFRVEYYGYIPQMFFVLDVHDKQAKKNISWTDLMVPLAEE